MLYALLKIPARFAFRIYCRKLSLNNKEIFNCDGPLLLASNHPNSFLDAIMLATLFKKPVHSLTRGDAFTKKLYYKLLTSLNMVPVYRISEGAENLGHNYKTFDYCKEIFKQNGIVLIFSEGACINEWHLRPLKKGTARLAISTWQEGIPLQVLPLGINYHSFTSFGKNIQLNFGHPITEKEFDASHAHGKSIAGFNDNLNEQLKELVIEIDKHDTKTLMQRFTVVQPPLKKFVLFLPAILGWLFHAAMYLPLKKFSRKRFAHDDHFDSVLIGMLFLLYPLFLILVSAVIFLLVGKWYGLAVLLVLPFCAWSYVQLKRQF